MIEFMAVLVRHIDKAAQDAIKRRLVFAYSFASVGHPSDTTRVSKKIT
jgi:hypothetical protein